MSKKRFTDGLESVFFNDPAETGQGEALLRNISPDTHAGGSAAVKKVSHRKNFTTDLDSLFEEAIQESFEEQSQPNAADPKAKIFHQQTHRRKPVSGLDRLIRSTVDPKTFQVEEDETLKTKRLTVTVDKKKLEKLKTIARLEKSYIKDIVAEMVAEYIKKYETSTGKS